MLWLWTYWTQHHPDGTPRWLRPRLRPVTALWLWPLLIVVMMICATEGQGIVSWVTHMYTGGR
jgi:hypothetical protein